MKVLFLDFDGVICTNKSIAEATNWFNSGSKNNDVYSIRMIDPQLVLNVNELIKKTDVKIVISSDWRYSHPLEELKRFLRVTGFCGEVIDKTPVWKDYKDKIDRDNRGQEIKMWLDEHPDVETFVILDDDILDIFPVFPYNYIHTDMDTGFHSGLIQTTINKLNNKEINKNE